ncbi:MAG: M18 family aminopeptidase, partial [Clostridia bacterium]|nr:M18 family aminopeptidase [Clostridia bacterium]
MTQENIQATEKLIAFIKDSPTAFHAVHTAAGMLEEAGFARLNECDAWDLAKGGKYYVTRNQSSILAFALPQDA